ncbi:MAG TPA: GNAT family N-acetyltransferase [Ktedonosporobacter sp.]|nr:GNAT family N-acetyltransferase [Ktedonosporobacter sp.]
MEALHVRRAKSDEIVWIIDLSQRVQDALTTSGSLQQIGPLPYQMVEPSIHAGCTYLLESPERRLGSVLVDPIKAPSLQKWQLEGLEPPVWYLHALMIEPNARGKGLGMTFLDGIKQYVLPDHKGSITLNCWAGNHKLRDFYLRAGFTLHGIYGEKDYEVAVFLYPFNYNC